MRLGNVSVHACTKTNVLVQFTKGICYIANVHMHTVNNHSLLAGFAVQITKTTKERLKM